MRVVTEIDVKKDSRNRITLPTGAEFEHYHVKSFDDGHLELYPRVLTNPLISMRTLEMMDRAMAHVATEAVGDPVDANAMLTALGVSTRD